MDYELQFLCLTCFFSFSFRQIYDLCKLHGIACDVNNVMTSIELPFHEYSAQPRLCTSLSVRLIILQIRLQCHPQFKV